MNKTWDGFTFVRTWGEYFRSRGILASTATPAQRQEAHDLAKAAATAAFEQKLDKAYSACGEI